MQPYRDSVYYDQITDKISSRYKEKERNQKIEQILTEAKNSNNPDEFKQSFIKMLSNVKPENREGIFKTFDYIAKDMENKEKEKAYSDAGLNSRLPDSINKQMLENRGKNAALGASSQIDWPNATESDLYQYMAVPELRPMAQEALKGIQEEKKEAKVLQKKLAPFRSALNIVGKLEDVIDKNSSAIGIVAGTANQFEYARKARQEMVTLGNSLLQLALPLTIRNSLEFKEAQKSLTNPHSTVATNMGAIKALRDIIESNIESEFGYGNSIDGQQQGSQGQQGQVSQETINGLF